MSRKQHLLHQLLLEDQEPFHLKNYIADRRCQLKKPQPAKPNLIQVKKCKPISSTFQASNFTCKNPCFFALTNSPDPRKSPVAFFDLHSPANRSPCRNSPANAIFLHIPAKTASLLLEAALRIQKQSTSKPKSSTQNKINGFGRFGSLFKRLSLRNKKVKEIISPEKEEEVTCKSPASGFLCSPNGRRSSTIWSGSSDGKSLNLDLESLGNSSSGGSDSEEGSEVGNIVEFGTGNYLEDEDDLGLPNYDEQFCGSPFHFVLLRSPTSGRCTPDFSSPATSPSRQTIKDKEDNGVGGLLRFQVHEGEDEEGREVEEEDKEQCSPVSVLDPPFEDDDEGCDDQIEDDGFDLECSYAIVQRAKKQLLRKLRRFEKLAGLDPLELEKRMLEQEHGVDDNDNNDEVFGSEEEAECRGGGLRSLNGEKNIDTFIIEELGKSSFDQLRKIPRDMKRLVSDLIDEEERDQRGHPNGEVMAKRVCKRVESWKDVESNTIDMMVEMDFRRDSDEWKRFQEQMEEAAFLIELDITGILMDELTEELLVPTEIQ